MKIYGYISFVFSLTSVKSIHLFGKGLTVVAESVYLSKVYSLVDITI